MNRLDDYDYLGGFMVSRCEQCYRNCSIVHRYSCGTPTHCPYGLNQAEFESVEEEEEIE